MMRIWMIRHGETEGNKEKRYVGRTDEPLSAAGVQMLKEKYQIRQMPAMDCIYVSPMKRCMQTADIIFGKGVNRVYVEEMRECDFGLFEYRNYHELNGRTDYQEWIDSNGLMAFPEGESLVSFQERCVKGFRWCVEDMIRRGIEEAAFVVHGGTIMAVLDAFSQPHKPYYDWQTGNGEGYRAVLNENCMLYEITKID